MKENFQNAKIKKKKNIVEDKLLVLLLASLQTIRA